ncbi:helix-turn-helix transcriptional regulator [Hymenobacter chitinivorans]|uniref:AraC family transcriptional regulator n=1 Tax=Hymenobacter chitinivorans DSM 11115 TaxID=1121954 RepID=A0A2M9BT03_9BACT|nr:helix-turn-helix transcriptional regulator [Hymenobacter chitinivorans]PJJ61061.1 AraC family transcriptional regulator [Hymenobacter chitinivorans DSM 11115]
MPDYTTCTYTSELYEQPALASSSALNWPGARLERYQLPATTLPAHAHEQHLLLVHQGSQPVVASRRTGSRVEADQFRSGDVGLYPGGEYGPFGWDGPVDIIQVHLDAPMLETRARRDLDLRYFTLHERFRCEDGLLAQLSQQLLAAAGRAHTLGQLYAESLVTTLCYHLIEHHATFERRLAAGAGGRLPAVVLGRVDAYLEAHSEAPITLEVLAGLANLSVFHFARRFKHTTGRSPYQYVLDWKIRRARALLRAGELPVAAIGDALGFASPAHFAAAFKRAVGQSPRAFQQS